MPLTREQRLEEALRFYADPKNWSAGRWPTDAECVDDLICVDWQEEEGGMVPFADCGDRARLALKADADFDHTQA